MSLSGSHGVEKRKKLLMWFGALGIAFLVTLGVFASNGWLPSTDPLTGRKTGWFGRELPKNASSSWNPFAAPIPNPTPQLSKEYVYASGSRLLAVEDANATVAPPADIAVWTPSNGWWAVMGQTGSQATGLQFGISTDIPIPGDYDGDGKTDFSVYRPGSGGSNSIFFVWPSGGGSYFADYWGISIDKPAMGDFDGDGKHDIVIARPNTGSGTLDWWIRKSSDSTYYSVSWGLPTDDLAVADYDGDGIADRAVYRSSDETFYAIRSSNGTALVIDIGVSVSCSPPKQCVVPSDYDGDGKADPAVFNPSNATWYIYQSTTNSIVSQVWGNNGTSGCTGSCSALFPVQNDYDLDGKTDLAVWNNASSAVWTIRRSSNGTTRTETFGTTGDIPVPAFYRR